MIYIPTIQGGSIYVSTYGQPTQPDVPVVPPDTGTVTISWNLNGGTDGDGNSTIPDSVVEVGNPIPIPNAIRTGYTFDGWWSENQQLTSETTATSNATYTANWIEDVPYDLTEQNECLAYTSEDDDIPMDEDEEEEWDGIPREYVHAPKNETSQGGN